MTATNADTLFITDGGVTLDMAHLGGGNDAHIGSETVLSGIITTGYARKTIIERKTAQDYGEIGACDLGDGMPSGLLM